MRLAILTLLAAATLFAQGKAPQSQTLSQVFDAQVNTIERALYYTRGDNNDHDFAVWQGPGGLEPLIDARDWVPIHPQGSRYAIPWAVWYSSNGKEGAEPPPEM